MPYQLKSADINMRTLSFGAFRLYKSAPKDRVRMLMSADFSW